MNNHTFHYKVHISARQKHILDIDDFEIPREKITFLFGESGIGKSMISKAIYGLLDPQELDIVINEKDYETYLNTPHAVEMKEYGFFVFQEPSSHLNPLLTLSEQLREGSLAEARSEADILRMLWETTHGMGVRQILGVYPKPYRPSGGEKQRLLLAMAFKKIELYIEDVEPSPNTVFVFDEPTGSLDNDTRNLFLKALFDQFRGHPFTVLLVTHDYSMISEVFQNHTDLVDRIAFKELALKNDRLSLNTFSPQFYLDWLASNKKDTARKRKSPRRSPKDILLRLESGVTVFGRRLVLSRYAQSSKTCPLIIRRNQIVYLKAASGVGKTTMAKIIMGLVRGRHLDLRIDGLQLTDDTPTRFWQTHLWGRKIGMVFQHADEALNLNSKVKDIFTGLPHPEQITPEYTRRQLREYFPDEMDEAFLNKPMQFLSGGQKQRLNLLRTLSLDTDLLILDEPLNGLDFLSIKKMIALLQARQEAGKGILLISHNEEIFDSLGTADRLFLKVEFAGGRG